MYRPPLGPLFSVAAALSLAALAAVPAPGISAQVQAGGDGRALDANPQVGSGGGNRIESQIDYAARNNLITGNVGGGFGFQDDVGYRAPGEFQGNLGSNDLFRFRADSLGSAPAVSGASRGYINPGQITVYNDFTTPARSNYAGSSAVYTREGGIYGIQRLTPGLNTTVDPQSPDLFAGSPGGGIASPYRGGAGVSGLGIVTVPDGGALAVTADPLMGIRRERVQPPTSAAFDSPDTFDAAGTPLPLDPIDPLAPGNLENPGATGPPRLQRGASSTYIDPAAPSSRAFRQGPADNAEQLRRQSSFTDGTGLVKPTLQLGQMATNRADASPSTIEQRVARLQASIFGPTTPTPGSASGSAPGSAPGTAPGQAADDPAAGLPGADLPGAGLPGGDLPGGAGEGDAYTRLLNEIRDQARARAEARRGGGSADEAEERDNRPAWMRALEEPSEEAVGQAETNLQATLRQIKEATQRRRDAADRDAGDAATDDQNEGYDADPARRTQANAALDALLSDLSYDVRLETLVAEREGRLNTLFQEAEDAMAAGRFLNAERNYRQIRLEAPDNPLAEAGMIHAQLGAGMVRSAAFNLRTLFEDHPELIATRYGQNLLPPADRLDWLRQELQRMIDAEASNLDPGLMMAYLGHQVESRQLVRYGLAIAEDASPLDPLLPVLRRIWLDTPAPGTAGPGTPASGSPAPGTAERGSAAPETSNDPMK